MKPDIDPFSNLVWVNGFMYLYREAAIVPCILLAEVVTHQIGPGSYYFFSDSDPVSLEDVNPDRILLITFKNVVSL